MIRALCVFGTQERMQRHIDTMFYVHSATFDRKNMRLIAGDLHIYYRVVKDMEDVMQIAGMDFQLVEWHYTPSDEVRNWVMSRVRGVV